MDSQIKIKNGRKCIKFQDKDNIWWIPVTYFPLPIHGKKDQTQQAWKND